MKLAFSTLGCPDWTWEQIVNCAVENGIEALEIRGVNSEMDPEKVPEFSQEQSPATCATLREKKLSIISFGSSSNFHDPANRDSAIAEGIRNIDVAARMGAKYIRVFGDLIKNPDELPEIAARVISGITELCTYAADKNISVLMEIHGNFNSIEAIHPVLDGCCGVQNFGILWDIEHSDKIYEDHWEEFYLCIKPFVRHVHIKDYIRAKNSEPFRLTAVGEGEIPIAAIVQRLHEDGYDGYFSLEWEKKWVPELPEFPIGLASFLAVMEKFV